MSSSDTLFEFDTNLVVHTPPHKPMYSYNLTSFFEQNRSKIVLMTGDVCIGKTIQVYTIALQMGLDDVKFYSKEEMIEVIESRTIPQGHTIVLDSPPFDKTFFETYANFFGNLSDQLPTIFVVAQNESLVSDVIVAATGVSRVRTKVLDSCTRFSSEE